MNSNIFRIIVLGSFILFSLPKMNYAQQSSIQIESIPLPEKDISSFAVHVAQDSTGFLWFATTDGLYRYDGYTFTNFAHDPQDSTSLSSNYIENIYVDRKGTLWVGTIDNGLNQFHSETETFTHFQHDPRNPLSLSSDTVRVITEDHLGQLWVGTMSGLNRLDRQTKTFTRYYYDPDDTTSLGNDDVRSLYVDSQGTLWIGTIDITQLKSKPGPGGLNRFNRKTGTFTRYLHDPNDPNSLMSNQVSSMFEDSRGNFWVGTQGDVLHKMDRENGQFQRLIYNPDTPGTLLPPSEPSLPLSGGVTFIDEDSSGRLWFGYFSEGLLLYDPDMNSYTHFANNEDNSSSLFENAIWGLHTSNDGSHWITSLASANVIKVTASNHLFNYENTIPFSTLYLDNSGILWSSRFGGIDNFSYSTNKKDSNPYQRSNFIEIGNGHVGAIHQSRNGTLLIGFYAGNVNVISGGLYRLNPEDNEVSVVFTDFDRSENIGPIIDIYEDPDGFLWLGTQYTGLFRFDPTSNTLTQYEHDLTNPNSLSHNSLTKIHSSKSNPRILWIGTEQGLNRFDTQTETFTRYLHDPDNSNSLAGEFVKTIYEDEQERLWIGTHAGGLSRFDMTNDQFKQYTIYNSGLTSNNVACILGSSDGSLWMGIDQKLTHFDPHTELFYTYNENHGVPSTPFISECSRDTEGQFFFGVRNGFLVFDPDQIPTNSTPSPVIFTDFRIDNQPVRFGSDSPLQVPIWLSEQINLSYQDNTFSLEFSGLDFRKPEVNQYAYKLEGYNDNWNVIGNLRRANFENIPNGEYTLQVRAANRDGVWNMGGASIGITILPPWWQTWWAYGLYVLIFAAGVFAVDRFQRRRLIKKEQEKAKQRELEQEKTHAREIEKAYQNLETAHSKLETAHENLKSAQDQLVQQEKLASLGQLTAGIAHEIKNPLNFVNNFSEVSLELVEEAREEVNLLRQGFGGQEMQKESPFEGGSERSEQGDDAISAMDETPSLLLDILDDIETNLKTIYKHGSRADSIVKSMLQHSRGGDGTMEPTPLNPLIKEYVNLAFHGMRAGNDAINVDIDLQLDENVGEVPLVAEDFSRVILNLVNNAFDAMREKTLQGFGTPGGLEDYQPKLTVRTKSNSGRVIIEIEDNGPGIPDEMKDKILQPFFTTKKGTAGTGLGLSITNDIIKAHGGTLDIESFEGKTIFSITLQNSL